MPQLATMQKPIPPIVIVGMGPGGMVAAIELAKKGKQVVIFEKREHFTRGQKVKLAKDNRDYLNQLQNEFIQIHGVNKNYDGKSEDEAFLKELNSTGGEIEVAKIQEYLKRMMQILYPESIVIKQGKGIEVKAIDPKTNCLFYVDLDGTEKKNGIFTFGCGRWSKARDSKTSSTCFRGTYF